MLAAQTSEEAKTKLKKFEDENDFKPFCGNGGGHIFVSLLGGTYPKGILPVDVGLKRCNYPA